MQKVHQYECFYVVEDFENVISISMHPGPLPTMMYLHNPPNRPQFNLVWHKAKERKQNCTNLSSQGVCLPWKSAFEVPVLLDLKHKLIVGNTQLWPHSWSSVPLCAASWVWLSGLFLSSVFYKILNLCNMNGFNHHVNDHKLSLSK